MSGAVQSSTAIPHDELQPDHHLPSYLLGSFTTMTSMRWNLSRVMVREGEERLLARELGVMSSVSQLLLLMGHCPATQSQKLKLVFEPVMLG